ncbi:hypothetical protein ACFX11_039393 [Malus domestica]
MTKALPLVANLSAAYLWTDASALKTQSRNARKTEAGEHRIINSNPKFPIPQISNLRDLEENEVEVSLCVGQRLADGKIATGHFTFKLHEQTQEGEKGETESLKRTLMKL